LECITLRFQEPEISKELINLFKNNNIVGKNNINKGKQLLKITTNDLKNYNLKSMGHRMHIKTEIDKLEKSRSIF
jgi:hypothetical protein